MRGAILLLCAGLLALLAACTPADLATLRQVTVDDGAAYVIENHDRRKEIRKQLYAIEDEVIRKCVDRARDLDQANDLAQSLETLNWCLAFLDSAYPDLATIEALREGKASLDELRETFAPPTPEPANKPRIAAGAGTAIIRVD